MNSLPEVFQNYFLTLKQTHDYRTRSTTKQKFYINPDQTSYVRSFIKLFGAKYRNQIPTQLKHLFF